MKELIEKIKDCGKCELREEAKKTLGNNKIYWVFYAEPGYNKEPQYMFLMQNPNKDGLKGELKTYSEKTDNGELIRTMRKYFLLWMCTKNEFFSKELFKALKKYKLIGNNCDFEDYFGSPKNERDKNNYEGYEINCNFFNDFYVTDLVKCRASTSDLETEKKKKDSNCEICFENFLKEEIEQIKPKVIFCFGSRTWDVLRKKYGGLPDEKVAKVHGGLFESKKGFCVIPLAHFSQRQFNFYLRNSYFDYLEEGLRHLSQKIVAR